MKQLISFSIDNVIDIITNSSSELFVMKSDDEAIVISLIEAVNPSYSNGFYGPLRYKDMDETTFAECIETIYGSYSKEKAGLFLFSGFTFEEQFDYDSIAEYYDRKRSFLKENKAKLIQQIDPNGLLWFLVPKEEHEYVYKDLAELGTTYFMSM